MSNIIKKIIYTHRRHLTIGLPAQVLHRLLHQVGDGGGGWNGGRRHGGGVEGGVDGVGHLLHHRRDVNGRVANQVHGVDHGGDDGDGGVLAQPLIDGREVVARRHLLRVPLDLVPQSHLEIWIWFVGSPKMQ